MEPQQPWQTLIAAAESGHQQSKDQLFATLYTELRRLARRELARIAGPTPGLSATTLVHEAYADLAQRSQLNFPDKGRFMAYIARSMRGLIIDAARRQGAQKRGAEFHITRFDTAISENATAATEFDRLSEALDTLGVEQPQLAEVVDLKYFCGLSFVEIAALRGVAERTVRRDWEKARLLLYAELNALP